MASYLHPGVYIEEIPSGARPIEGVSTSTAAFVGTAFRGPVHQPELINGWDDFVKRFGDFRQASGITDEDDAMGLAVRAFYQNGGKAAYVCLVRGGTPATAATTLNPAADLDLGVEASSPGSWGDLLRVTLHENSSNDQELDLLVGTEDGDGNFDPLPGESFLGLSLDERADNFIEKVINDGSRLIRVELEENNGATQSLHDAEVATDFATLGGGGDGSGPAADDYASFYNDTLRKYRDISIMLLPGERWPTGGGTNDVITNTLNHCESTMSRVLILDPPGGHELRSGADVQGLDLPPSSYAVLYYPWVRVTNPLHHPDLNPTASRTLTIPPSPIAAALWARTDGRRGVWKAPAGVETRINVSGLEYQVEDLEQGGLNPAGVNCLRNRAGFGPVIWGSRTLATRANPEWRYVPVRRTAIFIEQSLYNGIQWSVFEPNDHPLWSSLRANIGSFMNGLFRAGAFQGATANDAYFVRCGLGDTMTQGDIDRGQVIVVVGFAPLKPAEFVILRIQQKVAQQ